MKEDHMSCPFPKKLIEPIEWIHCLATLDTVVLRLRPNFCDDDGYDAHPLYMVDAIESNKNELQVTNRLAKKVPIRMIRVIPNEQDEQQNNSIAFFRKGEVSFSTSNKNILPPWHPI